MGEMNGEAMKNIWTDMVGKYAVSAMKCGLWLTVGLSKLTNPVMTQLCKIKGIPMPISDMDVKKFLDKMLVESEKLGSRFSFAKFAYGEAKPNTITAYTRGEKIVSKVSDDGMQNAIDMAARVQGVLDKFSAEASAIVEQPVVEITQLDKAVADAKDAGQALITGVIMNEDSRIYIPRQVMTDREVFEMLDKPKAAKRKVPKKSAKTASKKKTTKSPTKTKKTTKAKKSKGTKKR